MNTKRITYVLLLFFITSISLAQVIYLETGKTSSSFDYKNSQGEEIDNLQAVTNAFMGLGYRTTILDEKLSTSFGLGYFGYGAIGSDETLEGILEWNANYLELSAGLDYSLFNINKTEFYAKGMFSTGFLVQGTQTLNNEIFDLKKVDDFNKAMISFKVGAGLLHPVSNELSFYLQYFFGKSLNQSGNSDNESLKIVSHNICFGVMIKLFKSNQP